MKALLLVDEKEDKISIEEIETPGLKNGQALVRIKAAALNHRDQFCREGKYPGLKYGTVLGSDGAGVVEAVEGGRLKHWIGKDVIINPNINWGSDPQVQSNDYHILGMPTHGTFAEYVVVDADRLHEKPSHLNLFMAAALPLGGVTAYRAVFRQGKVKAGDNVLISGVGGGVAHFAFLFSMVKGATVFVTSGDDEKINTAKNRGAKQGFNYKEDDWDKKAMEASGGFNVIIDSAGGDQLNTLVKIMKPAGRIVLYGATNGMPSHLDLFRLFWKQGAIQGSTMGNDQEFEEMVRFVNEHQIEPIIDSIRPFDKIIEAFDEMKAGSQTGKLVVEF